MMPLVIMSCFIYVLACSLIYMFTLAKFMCKSPRGSICLIVGSCLLCAWARVIETSKDEDVLLLLRGKQRCLCLLIDYEYCLLYVLCLMQCSVVYNLIPRETSIEVISKWSISYRCCQMAVYICLTYCLYEYSHELSCCHSMCFQFYQLPSCNLFTQHSCFIIIGESPLVKLWPPVHSFTLITTLFTCFLLLLACWSVFSFIVFNHIFHTIHLILCFQQDGKIYNLP